MRINYEFQEGDYIEVKHSAGIVAIVTLDTSMSRKKEIGIIELTPEKARGLINEISKAIKAEEKQ